MRGVQKPAWHRPMPARVRRLMPSMSSAPTGRRMASRISASVTVSQRQTTLPKSGLAAMAASRSAAVISRNLGMALRMGLKSGFSFSSSLPAICSDIHLAMAGEEVRPGDSTAQQLKNPGASSGSPRTKSPASPVARRPEKVVMKARVGIFSQVRAASRRVLARPNAVVRLSSLSSMSSAVGPMSTVPSTVGATRMPLPILVGSWNMAAWNTSRYFLSTI